MSRFLNLLRKELALYYLDQRFLVVFGLSALLAATSVLFGAQNYLNRRDEAAAVIQSNQSKFLERIQEGNFGPIFNSGHRWSRPPSPLSPLVFGQSGSLPREATIRFQQRPSFESNQFSIDPLNALFGVLDLSFIATVVLSLCVLLFTHDALCGEKQAGTLRAVASFSIPRATLAVSKIVGSTIAVIVPLVFAFLLSALVLVLMPDIALSPVAWAKAAGILAVFGLHLSIFAAVGVLVSSLVERRSTSFILLLGIWTFWLFVVPNAAMRLAERIRPAPGYNQIQQTIQTAQEESQKRRRAETEAYFEKQNITDWSALSEERRREIGAGATEINRRHDEAFRKDEADLLQEKWNAQTRRNQVARWIALLSPVGATTVITEDLAGTGLAEMRRSQRHLAAHLQVLDEYVRNSIFLTRQEDRDLSDFPMVSAPEPEPLGEVLARNLPGIVNLLALLVLGYTASFVAILRYDVR